MEGYPTNPNQPKRNNEPEKKKLAKGKEVEKSKASRLLDSLIVEDWTTIKKYLLNQVILPGVRDLISNIYIRGWNAAFNGVSAPPPPSSQISTSPINYNAISSQVRVIGTSNMTQPYKNQDTAKRYNFKQLGYSTEREAWDVLDQLRDDIVRYKRATLLSYYEYSEVDTESTESNWGWRDLSYADVQFDPASQSWVIRLPKVQYLG